MFMVLGTFINRCFESYICQDYPCLHQEKLSKKDKSSKNTTFDNIYGIGITDVLMNIMECHGS